MKPFPFIVLLLVAELLPIPCHSAPGTIPKSPWELASRVHRAVKNHDKQELNALICWTGVDSLGRSITRQKISGIIEGTVTNVTFHPKNRDDQIVALNEQDSTTYRYNLERVGYLHVKARCLGGPECSWAPSVGQDANGYRITLWSSTSQPFRETNWNTPPPPRQWLNDYYSHRNPRGLHTYIFRDADHMARYYRDILALSYEDEKQDRGHWREGNYYPLDDPQHARTEILGNMEGIIGERNAYAPFEPYSPSIPLLAIQWCLTNDLEVNNQLLALTILEKIPSPSPFSDSLVVEALARGHQALPVIERTLRIAYQRNVSVPEPVLLPYLLDYRPGIANAAQTLSDDLGYSNAPKYEPGAALNSPKLRNLFGNLDSLLAPVPKVPFVEITPPFGETERKWILAEDLVSTTLVTPFNQIETVSGPIRSHSSPQGGHVTRSDKGIEAEARRVIPSLGSQAVDIPGCGPGQTDPAPLYEISICYWLYKHHHRALASDVLLPLLDSLGDASELSAVVQDGMGLIHGYRMIVAFAGNRDYGAALQEARLIVLRYPNSLFSHYAREMVRQLPLRMDDFNSFRLPTPDDWIRARSGMNREEQIRFLCKRLRLLSGDPFGPQYAEAPGMAPNAAETLDRGKTPVINPVIELKGAYPESWSAQATQPGGVHLTLSDVPTLAEYLQDDWFIGGVEQSGGMHYAELLAYPRTLYQTRWVLLEIIQALVPNPPFHVENLQAMDPARRQRAIEWIIEWARGGDQGKTALNAVLRSQDYLDVHPMMNYLVENKVRGAVPKLLTFLDPDLLSPQRGYILACCRKIDASACLPEARKYLMDPDPEVRLNAGLIVYGAGDKMDGLMAIAAGINYASQKDKDEAVAVLRATKGADERAVADMATEKNLRSNDTPR
jgi:hypothetical protein